MNTSAKAALVVSAHSADFVWRAGGAIALHAAAVDVLRAAEAREEAATRARPQAGELGLDMHNMREELARKGLTYRTATEA